LSFAVLRAHSRDSSAHARYSSAVIIFISISPHRKQSRSEAQSVTNSNVVPVLHFSTWPPCRKRRRRLSGSSSKLTYASCWPLWSRTTKHSSNSSTDHGGGKVEAFTDEKREV